jgi:hypothetical protein
MGQQDLLRMCRGGRQHCAGGEFESRFLKNFDIELPYDSVRLIDRETPLGACAA